MAFIEVGAKRYETDETGFLVDSRRWDEDFARALASQHGIEGGLTETHWAVIRFVRRAAADLGRCPLVYQTCRANGLTLAALERLFPTGYLRGACRLAGITFRQAYYGPAFTRGNGDRLEQAAGERRAATTPVAPTKTYRVDVRGFLVDPAEWDPEFAMHRAHDMKLIGLSERHWQVIHYLRSWHADHGVVPTVYQTCRAHGMDLERLEKLFPDGYHRGAVKLAGLRVV